MTSPLEYYNKNLELYKTRTKDLKKSLWLYSILRLLVFSIAILGIYLMFNNWKIATVIGVVAAAIFIFLLSKYTDLKHGYKFHKALIAINLQEIEIAKGNFKSRPSGSGYKNPDHFFSEDIDLFGQGSFFQFINRTSIDSATDTLAEVMLANNITDIASKQGAIKELSQNADWRQRFSASSSLIKVETKSEAIENWIVNYKPFLKKPVKLLPPIFGVATLIVFVIIYLKILPISFLLYWIILGLAITGVFIKKINALSNTSDKARETIRQYAVLLHQIEGIDFKSQLLRDKQMKIMKSNVKASNLFKSFSSALDTLDNRNNFIYAIFGNGLFLTDIRNTFRVENWINENKDKIRDWFEVIAFFDAYNSLGNFAFNHPAFNYPIIIPHKNVINAKGLGHPLLNEDKRIDNDIVIKQEEFFIVTGANMAGKSTFLRTVSLHIVMANLGLPVCAETSEYSPVKLITSMRTSDSLKDDSSYFFSELSRLKFIVDSIKQEPYFIVLDEILKGTNSTDKAIGSKKFVEKLVSGNATGIIATHDLSLCEIEHDLKDVKNYFFDAQIIDDELYFDYKFKKGICQNMNASFLLKKMEII